MSSISAGTTSTTTLVHSGDTTGSLVFKTNDTGSGGTTAVTIDTSQRAAFVAGTAALPAITTAGDTNTGIFFPAADTIAFSEGGTEAMRIDSSGNVGIGTTSTSAKLSVSLGSVSTLGQQSNQALALLGGGSNNQLCQIGMGYGTGTTYTPTAIGSITTTQTGNTIADLIFATRSVNTDTAPSERMRIDSSGNLLVGTTSNNTTWNAGLCLSKDTGTTKWAVGPYSTATNFVISSGAGSGVYLNGTSATSWASASDERLKENLIEIDNGLVKVCALRSVIGNFISDKSKQRKAFLIAQDVQSVLPEAVSIANEKDGYLGVAYTDVIPLLVASIKELKAINDQQAETINALTARVVALESK